MLRKKEEISAIWKEVKVKFKEEANIEYDVTLFRELIKDRLRDKVKHFIYQRLGHLELADLATLIAVFEEDQQLKPVEVVKNGHTGVGKKRI